MLAHLDVATVLTLLGAGAVTGFLAGLFGVGGGAITVPLLFEAFRIMEMSDEVAMPLAVGTSLAVIVPTSLRSAQAHWRKGAIDLALLKAWALPVAAGTLIGAAVAHVAPPDVFQGAFVVVASIVAAKLLLGKPKWRLGEVLPGGWLLRAYGGFVGFVASLMGIGGGAISTLLLTLYAVPIHRAIATSAGVGVLISIPGTIGYIAAGWGKAGLPPDALGFISPVAFALIVPATLLTAPVGANLAHRLPRRILEILFGSFLMSVSIRFLVAMITA